MQALLSGRSCTAWFPSTHSAFALGPLASLFRHKDLEHAFPLGWNITAPVPFACVCLLHGNIGSMRQKPSFGF
jgi:hypothetical protein